ncbi:MAG: hypothetical protein ACTSW1_09365 [Candidatus Hodarchaeales archaeon]
MKSEVIFCAIDQTHGHKIIYSKLDQDLTNRISLRTQIALGLSKGLDEVSEVTLPFSLNNRRFLVYSTIFPLRPKTIGLMAWVKPEEEKTSLFTNVPLYRRISLNIIEKMTKLAKDTNNVEGLKNEFENELNSQLLTQQLMGQIVSIEDLEEIDQMTKDTGYTFLKSIKTKDLAVLLRAAIFGDPILVIGDEYLFNMIADNLLLFNYRGLGRKAYHSGELKASITREINILGIPDKDRVEKKILQSFEVVFYISKKKIIHKNKRAKLDYVEILAKNLQKEENKSIDDVIEEYFIDIASKDSYAMLILNSLTQEQDDKLILETFVQGNERPGLNVETTLNLLRKLKQTLQSTDFKVIMEICIRNNPRMKDLKI